VLPERRDNDVLISSVSLAYNSSMANDHEVTSTNLKVWDPDAPLTDLEGMPEYRSSDFKSYDVVKKLADVNAPGAMQSIIHLAMNSPNDATRLKAAQYVVDRACGRIADLPQPDSIDDELQLLIKGVLKGDS
jgi:hypothetical protein